MDPDVQSRLDQQDVLLNKIYISVEKTRKYIFWTGIFTCILFVLPLIASAFIIPKMLEDFGEFNKSIGTQMQIPIGY